MPVKNPDPFFDFLDKLDPNVNPYVAQLQSHTQHGTLPLSYGQGLKKFVGHWRGEIQTFHQPTILAPEPAGKTNLILEIGCHNGHTLTEMALEHPDMQFVGFDITFKRVIITAERLAKSGVKNAFCALANAQKLSQIFKPHELDGVVIFFPDPWVKKARQTKNRLVSEAFMQELKSVIKPNGFLWFKSDQKVYFDQVVALMEQNGMSLQDGSDVPKPLSRDYSSNFEKRFRGQGLPTYGVVATMPGLV